MAVRIALQCSEADAHLILSEQNPAAKLLSRPGEAIYNDANGAPEGNHFFQVVWLSDARREEYLEEAPRPGHRPPAAEAPRVPIVFEGDAEAELARNPTLRQPCWKPRVGPEVAPVGPGLAGRPGGDQGADLGPVPPPGGESPPGRRPERRGGARDHGRDPASAWPRSTRRRRSDRSGSGARFYRPGRDARGRPGTPGRPGEPGRRGSCPTPSRWGLARRPPDRRRGRRGGRPPPAARRRRRPRNLPPGPRPRPVPRPPPPRERLRLRQGPGEDALPADHLAAILKEGSALGVHLVIWSDNLANLNRAFDNRRRSASSSPGSSSR